MAVLSKKIEQLVPINRYVHRMSHVFRRAMTTVSTHVSYSAWVGTCTKLNVYLKQNYFVVQMKSLFKITHLVRFLFCLTFENSIQNTKDSILTHI